MGGNNSNEQYTILLVEDEEICRQNLKRILSKEGYSVDESTSGVNALKLLNQQEYDLVLTDLKMKNVDGMEILRASKALYPHTEVIMITGYATVHSAVEAMREGAYHYIAKPFQLNEVRKIVWEALLKRKLTLENKALKDTLAKHDASCPQIIGKSQALTQTLDQMHKIAPTDANVLIFGESGTGKELFARAIHSMSPRADKRFVAFNCGSFAEDLMANELFGHEKGAYTGAHASKKGLLQVADKGTVFLDEVGDMPMSMQIKLLRVIQEREFIQVGGTEPVPVDVRFIAATHRDLKHEVQAGRFRQDLYYRLNVISLQLPPLSERNGDIPLLTNHFLAKIMHKQSKEIREVDPEAMALLEAYSWPGNVRELENVMERAVALSTRDVLKAEVLPEYIRSLSMETFRRHWSRIPTMDEQEMEYILWVLKKCQGNKTKAAQVMGIDRVSLWRKLKRYGVDS
ncbi:MAG: sigma-54-dependent Fis family transcriptional regulator [Desulfovermiculus sp.]|nr:sigma-54-dependent Fis family transcriptional regulator [Desulfovermiculus sp.]